MVPAPDMRTRLVAATRPSMRSWDSSARGVTVMRKLFVLSALLLSLAACSPERRACSRLMELCGGSQGGPGNREQCEGALAKLRSAAGPESVEKSARCIGEA